MADIGEYGREGSMAKMQWWDAWWPADLNWRNQPEPVRMEEYRSDGMLTLRMEVPGVDPDRDMDIHIDDGTLTVAGRRCESEQVPERSEFHYGEFVRRVVLPRGVDEESVKARYHEGILEITMAMPEGTGIPRRVPVESTRQSASAG